MLPPADGIQNKSFFPMALLSRSLLPRTVSLAAVAVVLECHVNKSEVVLFLLPHISAW